MPRLALVGVVLLFASATLAVGAAKRLTAVPKGAPAPVTAPTLVVPDVAGQAFVFAKGTLEDTGFAWHVLGSVHGYAANKVESQSPPAGTRVRDTGAPTIVVKLARTAYPQKGQAEDVSPYVGTPVQPIHLAATKLTPVAAVPLAPKGPENKDPAGAKLPTAKTAAPSAAPHRPAAFFVEGAPAEPMKEMPLTRRAKLLTTWITAHPRTKANVRHFLYQHSWIVTGAAFGWWHGAEALEQLIAADQLAQQRWGIGTKSELVASRTLAEVKAGMK